MGMERKGQPPSDSPSAFLFSQHPFWYFTIFPIPAGMSKGQGKSLFCINQYGECEREKQRIPLRKKKSLISETELPNLKIPGGQKLSNKL